MVARLAIAVLCFAGEVAAVVGSTSDAADVAYATACRNYDAQDITLTLAGATAAVRDYISRVNLTCRATSTCEQCFNLTRLDGITNSLLDQSHFRAVAAWLLLASLDDAIANSTSHSSGTSCPYSGVGLINSTQPMNDLVGEYRSGGITAVEQLEKFISALRNIYRGISSSCFSVNSLLTELGISNDTVGISEELIAQLLSYTFIHMAKGHTILDDCPILPTEQQLASDLMELLDVQNTTLSLRDLSDVMQKLTAGTNDSRVAGVITQPSKPAQMCLSSAQLLAAYGFDALDNNATMPANQLLVMSPGLLQQKLGGYCSANAPTEDQVLPSATPSLSETYGYGTLAVLIISLLPLLGILLLPCMTTRAADLILTLFTALAIGTMLSDALMHIFPEILNNSSDQEGPLSENLLEMATTLIGLYAFFLFEMSLHIARKKMHANKVAIQDGGQGSDTDHGHSHSHAGHGHSHFDVNDLGLTTSTKSITKEDTETGKSASSSNTNERTPRCTISCNNIKPFALVVIAGDLLHNCADGLAVGAGFATSIRMGISLTIAVCCHEVPHEIGNFAVLLAAGIKKWKVLGLSLLSSSSCFIGLYIGASVGSNEQAADFIFAITAATFFYVSLVDLLPSLIHNSSSRPLLHFLMINIGLLVGFTIMFLFAIYEDLITL